MSVGTRESVALARSVILALRGKKVLPEVVICPSFAALSEVRKVIARSHVALGAQNMFWEEQGAVTGEISPRMLNEFSVSHVILGHSERRNTLGETDEMIAKKLKAALVAGFFPILCVGEKADERDAGKAQEVVETQLRAVLKGKKLGTKQKLAIAYEPVWAIGTGKEASVGDVTEMHANIRSIVREILPKMRDGQLQVIYGGSVNEENVYGFLREDEIDGVLVGGASVVPKQFSGILSAAIDVIEGQEVV